MSISTYSELKTAIANWLHRADLTAYVPDFIALAESRLNRELRLRSMEARATATLTDGYIQLPTGYLEMRNLQINTDPVRFLEYRTPLQIDYEYPSQNSSGIPKVYTIVGDEIQIVPKPDSGYTVEMAYHKKFDALSDSATTNWLLTNAPDLYLFGSLIEAEPFLKNDKRVVLWEAKYRNAIDALQKQDDRGKWSGNLTVRVG